MVAKERLSESGISTRLKQLEGGNLSEYLGVSVTGSGNKRAKALGQDGIWHVG